MSLGPKTQDPGWYNPLDPQAVPPTKAAPKAARKPKAEPKKPKAEPKKPEAWPKAKQRIQQSIQQKQAERPDAAREQSGAMAED